MEEFIILKSIFQKLSNAKSAFKRFTLPMISSILCAIFFSLSLDFKSGDLANIKYLRFGYLFLFGIFFYTFVILFERSLKDTDINSGDIKKNKLFRVFIYIITLPIMYGVYELIYGENGSFFEIEDKYIYYGLVFIFAVGSGFIAKIRYHKDYVSYVTHIFQNFITSNIYSTVLFIGISVIIFAISKLFNVYFDFVIYSKIFLFIFIPFNVGIFLSNFPKSRESFNDYDYPKAFKVLLIYILIPLCAIYSLILFTYFLKVIILNEIPRGIIVNLVIWFSICSVFIMFFATKINVKFVNIFRKYFPIIMIPNLMIMFYSIYLRINQYGMTENRYFIIAMGAWILFSYIYYIIYRTNSNIAVPIALTIIILFSFMGPISAYNLTKKSQNKIFVDILYKNSMVNGNKIVPKSEISEEDKKRIIEIISFMSKNHKASELSFIDEKFKFNSTNMKEVFGFESENYNKEDLNYVADANMSLEIGGYNKLLRVSSLSTEQIIGNYKVIRDGSNIKILLMDKKGEDLIANINMEEFLDKLESLKKSNSIINPEDLAIVGSKGNMNYKIIFNVITFANKNNPQDFYVDFYFITDREN